ncbi:hypothetical protein [Gillisia hiemivivida]|jgi:hypothetical protein|uniref:Uncharacterized protein n=1 Tax=Gillisia hiemivivida TaxID=291190 RepID=A0A5C7A2X8_9FLAO|nr:hypothetical protein [Gillisia hiemivivida]TXD95189.1 hypothetical protein ES724_03285 [Gillisia hiemivivida]
MENKIIKIDLKEFEGKTIYDFKIKIAEILGNMKIHYTIPSPNGPRKDYVQPYSSFDVTGNENHYLIEKIEN